MCTLCGNLINNTKNMYKINSTKKNKKKRKRKRGGQGGGKIYNFKCNLITHLRIQI